MPGHEAVHEIPSGLRTGATATYCALSRSTLEKLRVNGYGPRYAKLGKVVIYDTADLDAWIEARKRASTSETV